MTFSSTSSQTIPARHTWRWLARRGLRFSAHIGACSTFLLTSAALSAPSAADLATTVVAQKIYNKRGRAASWTAVQRAIDQSDIVLLGEQHNDATAHDTQLVLLEDTLSRHPHITLSLEFLERNEQPIIDDYLAGKISTDRFIRDTSSSDAAGPGTWVKFYQPLVDAAKKSGSKIVGANPPRRLARLVREKGYEALDTLPVEEQAWFTKPITTPTVAERQRFVAVMQKAARSHGAPGSRGPTEAELLPFLRSQELWNATMAQSILNARKAGTDKVLHIVGAFHVDRSGGILRELRARAPKARITTIITEPDTKLPRSGRADYIIHTPKGTK